MLAASWASPVRADTSVSADEAAAIGTEAYVFL